MYYVHLSFCDAAETMKAFALLVLQRTFRDVFSSMFLISKEKPSKFILFALSLDRKSVV